MAVLSLVLLDELSGLVNLVLILALGAVVRENPWRAGALASLPLMGVVLIRTGTTSALALAVAVVVGPVFLVISALLAKAGSMLVARGPDEAAPDGLAPVGPTGRRAMFDTKAQRGRFLVIVALVVMMVTGTVSAVSSRAADRKAEERVAEIRLALNGKTPEELVPGMIVGFIGDDSVGPVLPGGPYEVIRPKNGAIDATSQVRAGFTQRCIRVHLAADGVVTTSTTEGSC